MYTVRDRFSSEPFFARVEGFVRVYAVRHCSAPRAGFLSVYWSMFSPEYTGVFFCLWGLPLLGSALLPRLEHFVLFTRNFICTRSGPLRLWEPVFRLDSIVKSFLQSETGRQRELVSFEYGSFVFFYTTRDKSATETVFT